MKGGVLYQEGGIQYIAITGIVFSKGKYIIIFAL